MESVHDYLGVKFKYLLENDNEPNELVEAIVIATDVFTPDNPMVTVQVFPEVGTSRFVNMSLSFLKQILNAKERNTPDL